MPVQYGGRRRREARWRVDPPPLAVPIPRWEKLLWFYLVICFVALVVAALGLG